MHTFRTTHGMIETLKKITWRAKIEIKLNEVSIYVSKKHMEDVRVLSKKLGMAGTKYEIKKLRFFECWFKRFKIVDRKPRIFHASSFRMTIKGVPIISWESKINSEE